MTALVRYPDTAPEHARSWIDVLAPAAEYAKAVAGTDFVPRAMKGNPAAITAAILYGDEIGLGPMVSLNTIKMIEGSPTLLAKIQRALVQAAGHAIWPEELTATRATWCGRRRDDDVVTRITWTMDDARRAGLAGRTTYRNYPRQMLSARASAELVGAIFSDVVGGLLAFEEVEAEGSGPAAGAGAPDVTTPGNRRRKRSVSAVAAAPTPMGEDPRTGVLPPLPGEVVDSGGGAAASDLLSSAGADPSPAEGAIGSAPAVDVGGGGAEADSPLAPPSTPTPTDESPRMLTDAQRRRMHALFRDRGVSDRGDRLRYTSAVIGRVVVSAKELTAREGDALLDALEADRAPDADDDGPV